MTKKDAETMITITKETRKKLLKLKKSNVERLFGNDTYDDVVLRLINKK